MKKIISDEQEGVIKLDNITVFNIHVYRNKEKIYKLVWLNSGKYDCNELCGFIYILGNTASEPNFVSTKIKESIKLAIQAGYNVYQIDDPSELLKLLNNEINSI